MKPNQLPIPHTVFLYSPDGARIPLRTYPTRDHAAIVADSEQGTNMVHCFGLVVVAQPALSEVPKPFSAPGYADQEARVGEYRPCVLCGRAMKTPKWFLRVVDGGARFGHRAEPRGQGEMDWYAVGPECLRQHPGLRDLAVPADAI